MQKAECRMRDGWRTRSRGRPHHFAVAVQSILAFAWITGLVATAQPFRFPTANQALLEPGGEERFFVGTTGKPPASGMFGCVRSGGGQMHEGLDIRCVKRNATGEPVDAVLATADGVLAYRNDKPSLSNYGRYAIVRHRLDGLEIYSLYAHLAEIRSDLKIGQPVRQGEALGVMGRSTNTREGISKERAHVHFELNLLLSDRFPDWYRRSYPRQRNDHGLWNGQNMAGLDPRLVLLQSARLNERFSLRQFVEGQTELCRVLVRHRDFSFARRYASLIQPNPVAVREGVAAYEISLNFNGVPFRLVPRAASEIKQMAGGPVQLLAVNEAEWRRHPCRKLVSRAGTKWSLANNGRNLVGLMVH